jgi:hypothetical protein
MFAAGQQDESSPRADFARSEIIVSREHTIARQRVSSARPV